MFRRIAFCCVALIVSLVACDKDPVVPPSEFPLGRVVVLNGQDPAGVTVVAQERERGVHLTFDDAFDGASFALRNDTVASAASKGAGDLLYVGDLRTGIVQKIQMPAASNPAGVQFSAVGASPRVFVALRDLGEIAEVALPRGTEPIVRYRNAGVCPVDVALIAGAIWSVDANQRCASLYQTLGPSRLIRVPARNSSDTISLGAAAIGAQRAFVRGNLVLVMTSGDYFSTPGALTAVAAGATQAVPATRALPADVYAVSFRVGANDVAYVTGAPAFPPFVPRVYAINTSMNFTGVRVAGASHLRLIKDSGLEASCHVATADAAGNVYCVENGDLLSRVLVFNPAGDQIRSTPAGSPAYDITLR